MLVIYLGYILKRSAPGLKIPVAPGYKMDRFLRFQVIQAITYRSTEITLTPRLQEILSNSVTWQGEYSAAQKIP